MNEKELQIKLGHATEKFVAKTLRNFGYWVYVIPMKTNGQPCDIIAAKGTGKSMLIWLVDSKHVRNEEVSFTFNRIEPNQIASMSYARDFANIKNIGFCIFFDRDKQLHWLSFDEYQKLYNEGSKSINLSYLKLFTEVLKDEDDN